MHAQSGLAGRLDLCRQGAVEIERGNARMSVRIAGDPDVLDSAVLQQAALDQLDGGMERVGGLRAIARDDQDAAHRCLLHQAREPRGKVLRARKLAHGDVGNRLNPMRPQSGGDCDLLLGGTAGNCADIDAGVVAKVFCCREIGGGEPRRLKRGATKEIGNAPRGGGSVTKMSGYGVDIAPVCSTSRR